MRTDSLRRIFTVTLAAASTGFRGGGCGDCPDTSVYSVTALPRSPDPDAGAAPDEPTFEECERACGGNVISCRATTLAGDISGIECTVDADCGAGRRPHGLEEPTVGGHPEPLALWLARVAHLEEASVEAFRRLRADLRAHGAPRALLRRCSRAAADERRHARLSGALARRLRARPPRVDIAPYGPRSLEDIAVENAVEGCVNETFGALLARWRAVHARDPDIREFSRRIADDETRHAALSWSIHRWVLPRLTPAARHRVTAARRHGLAVLAERGGVRGTLAQELRRHLQAQGA